MASKWNGLLVTAVLLAAVAGVATSRANAGAADGDHAMLVAGDKVEWGPAPPGLPPGSKAAVLEGNPAGDGPFVIRAWLPDGYKVPPHWHPTAEHLTVLSGSLHAGMGDSMDPAKATAIGAGGYVTMEKEMRHWVWAEGDTVIQIHATGPFQITYVNAADDPRSAKPASR
jgi:quercetin dioxygenase-like cupin family protein